MKAINPNEIKDNFIELIGKEWMLVSAGDKEKFNMMTASWGGVGVLWRLAILHLRKLALRWNAKWSISPRSRRPSF